MPRIIAAATEESWELGELVEHLETSGFDARDEEGFAAFGPALKKLANNREFLADLMIGELKARCDDQVRDNQYSAQVVMLHTGNSGYLIRANFWPALKDSVIRHSGADPFLYGTAHDHNFSFLTVGYLGPGYWSEYYEYDYEKVVGLPGEKVDLRFIEKSKLDPGKVMLYRAHRDVHNQLPADEMSVSINIMEASPHLPFLSQYRFDPAKCEIAGILTRTSSEALLALAANHDGGNARDLVENFAARHPCDRIRFAALRELASAQGSVDESLRVLEQGIADPNALVAGLARDEMARLQAHRGWIERA